MNQISTAFSFNRFRRLLAADWKINRGQYIRISAAAIGCYLAVAILVSVFAIQALNNKMNAMIAIDDFSFMKVEYMGYYTLASFFITCLGLTILGSMTFISMNSRAGRISTIMLPASMTEKFLLRFLVYFIGGVVLLNVGFFIGELAACLLFAGIDLFEIFPAHMFDTPGITPGIVGKAIIITTLPMLLGNAIYSLGSALWPKTSWVKTWVVLQILWLLFAFTGAFGLFNIIFDFFKLIVMDIRGNEDVLFWCYTALFVALIAGCWLIAWNRFRNTQIVQRFMKK